MKSDTDTGNRARNFLLYVRSLVSSHTEQGFNCDYQNPPSSKEIFELPFNDRVKRIPCGLDPVEG